MALKKVLISLVILCVLCFTYVLGGILIMERDIELPYKIYTSKEYLNAIKKLENSYTKHTKQFATKEEYRNFIEQDLGISNYIYLERDMSDYAGKAYPLIRIITIDSKREGYNYYETFVHECIHVKEFIGQEDYVCFQTFKYLFESNELHNVGVWYGLSQLYGFYSGEYDISHLIVDYLTQK